MEQVLMQHLKEKRGNTDFTVTREPFDPRCAYPCTVGAQVCLLIMISFRNVSENP